jgi:AP-2 complex subunit mu-1
LLQLHLEINDFGYPQNSEIDTLKTYITTESIVSSAIAAEESSKITSQATGTTSWRRADVKYKKNEAFVDVVETVNLSMSAKGAPILYYLFIRLFIIAQGPCCEPM